MPAGEDDYEGVRYEDLIFDDVDWSEAGEHDPARRAERKGTSEADVLTAWADEAVRDERRWARSAGSQSGLRWQWWGATAWKAKKSERETYESER